MEVVFLIKTIEEGFSANALKELSVNNARVFLFSKTKVDQKFLSTNVVPFVFPENPILPLFSSLKLVPILLSDIVRKFSFQYCLQIRDNFSFLRQSEYLSNFLIKTLNKEYNHLNFKYISFWMDGYSNQLSLLKKSKKIKYAYSFAHGRDLFEWREPNTGKLPFKKFQLQYLNKVFSISNTGTEYLKNRYPRYRDKISTSYLGSYNLGISEFKKENVFTIVSCATIRDVKRIYLIAEALCLSSRKIKWIHIGNQNLNNTTDPSIPIYKSAIEKLKLNDNVEFVATNAMTNEEVYELYKKTSINLFVSVSETEGLPVSMMEAISFGIPLMGTDVGGCKEIITNETGVLLPENISAEQLVQEFEKFEDSELNSVEFRERVRTFWAKNFNIKTNYQKLQKELERVED